MRQYDQRPSACGTCAAYSVLGVHCHDAAAIQQAVPSTRECTASINPQLWLFESSPASCVYFTYGVWPPGIGNSRMLLFVVTPRLELGCTASMPESYLMSFACHPASSRLPPLQIDKIHRLPVYLSTGCWIFSDRLRNIDARSVLLYGGQVFYPCL